MPTISSASYRLIQALPLSYFIAHIRLDRPSSMYDWIQPYAIASVLALLVTAVVIFKRQVYSPIFVGIHGYFMFGWLALLAHWDKVNLFYGKLEGAAMMAWIVAVVGIGNSISPTWSLGLTQQSTSTRAISHWRNHAWQLLGFYSLCTLLTLIVINNTTSIILREFVPFIVLFTGTAIIQRKSLKTIGTA